MSITARFVLNRTSGYDPLYVHCDAFSRANRALGTVSTQYANDWQNWRDPLFLWEVQGMSDALVWPDYGQALDLRKNRSIGPQAGFVIESAGTYTVKLTATDGVDIDTDEQTVTVSAKEDLTTFVFSTDGDFTGAPAGTQVTQSSWDTIRSSYGQTNSRLLLLKGGNTFTTTASNSSSSAGSMTADTMRVASWGSGKAIIQAAANDTACIKTSVASGTHTDHAFQDLTLSRSTFSGCYMARQGDGGGDLNRLTLLRVEASDEFLAGVWGWEMDEHCYAECVVDATVYACFYNSDGNGSQNKIAILGSYLSNAETTVANEHVYRLIAPHDCILSYSHLYGAIVGGHMLKWGGFDHVTSTQDALCVSAYRNKIEANSGTNWAITISPINPLDDNRQQYVFFDQNFIIFGSASNGYVAVVADCSYASIRNNIVYQKAVNTGIGTTCFHLGYRPDGNSSAQIPEHIACHNNSWGGLLTATNNNNMIMVNVAAEAANCSSYNNVMSLPNISGSGSKSVYVESGSDNEDGNNIYTNSPGWVRSGGDGTGTLTLPGHFDLLSSSALRNAGANWAVGYPMDDWNGDIRPRDGDTMDQGAMIYDEGTLPGGGGGTLLNRLHSEGLFVGA